MGIRRAEIAEGPECTGNAADERTDGKGQELAAGDMDADHRGGGVHVADRHPFASDAALDHRMGEGDQRRRRHRHQEIAPRRRGEVMAEELQPRRRDGEGLAAVRKPIVVGEQPFEEELGAQRRGAEIETLDAQARQAEDEPRRRRDQACQHQHHGQRQKRGAQQEIVARKGADRHEGGRAERHQASIAHQEVEAEAGHAHHQGGDDDGGKPIVAGDEGHDHQTYRQRGGDGEEAGIEAAALRQDEAFAGLR